MAEKKQSIELKRVVMVKAIVTDGFKDNLTKELERAVTNIDSQGAQMTERARVYMENLKQKGLMQKAAAFKSQMDEEKSKQAAAKSDLLLKIEEAKQLPTGSEFVQGPLEGPVTLNLGDNLYKKVGGAEIIVKDGIVQEIRGA